MAGCSKQEKEEFLAYIGKEPTMPQMLEYVLKCRPTTFWNKELKRPVFNPVDAVDVYHLKELFEELSDPKTFDYYEDTWRILFRKRNEKKCSECHGWKRNEEFRFFKTCCRCRASTVEDDILKQEAFKQSQVCSGCHTRKLFSEFNKKNSKIYKTCVSCCLKKKPKPDEPPPPPPPPSPIEAQIPETEHPSHHSE